MKLIKGGVTKPKGFKANGMAAGIKRSGKPDLGLIVSDTIANCAAVFTKNSIKAAPLIISQKHIRNGKAQAIVANSGNANCFTGEFGLIYAEKTTQLFAQLLGISKTDVLTLSTGIIGVPLPYKKIQNSAEILVKGLTNKPEGSTKAAKAILTTDLMTKEIAIQFKVGGKLVTIGGITKGSGMIAPNMATMLAFITTDAAVSSAMLKKALREANEESFNCITVDGCMSTNDTVVILANGQAGNTLISRPGKDLDLFCKALKLVCLDLAKKIVIDGEGATKFITINIRGTKTKKQAKDIGLQIANSMLVKTAAFGSDPNWGRVTAAVGAVCIKNLDEKKIKLNFSSFKNKNIDINVDLSLGKETATCYTCDLSYEYVRINGEYN